MYLERKFFQHLQLVIFTRSKRLQLFCRMKNYKCAEQLQHCTHYESGFGLYQAFPNNFLVFSFTWLAFIVYCFLFFSTQGNIDLQLLSTPSLITGLHSLPHNIASAINLVWKNVTFHCSDPPPFHWTPKFLSRNSVHKNALGSQTG